MKIGLILDSQIEAPQTPPNIDKWEICKSCDDFMDFISKYYVKHNQLPYLISMTHDLSPEHFEYESTRIVGAPIMYSRFKSKTGFHAAKELVAFCRANNLKLNRVCVHSNNPMGASNIQKCINDYKKESGDIQDCFLMNLK